MGEAGSDLSKAIFRSPMEGIHSGIAPFDQEFLKTPDAIVDAHLSRSLPVGNLSRRTHALGWTDVFALIFDLESPLGPGADDFRFPVWAYPLHSDPALQPSEIPESHLGPFQEESGRA